MSENETKVVSLAGARDKDKSSKKEEKSTEKYDVNNPVVCSFCGRPNHMVIKMIKGPGVNICSECTMICLQYFIMEDKIPSVEVQKVLDSFWQGNKK